MEGVVKQTARWITLGALFLIPLTPLVVANSFFFPFITGKAFFFRIVVEIAVAAWAVLAVLNKQYRPRFSWIGAAALTFVVWMFVADLFAVNISKALWSNFERMEGWVLLAHLFAFFVAVGAVLRVEKKWFTWRGWFLASLGVSVWVVLYALFQLMGVAAIHQGSSRIDASFGNSAYLAIYLLFNFFIAGWLALTEERSWLKYSLIVLAFIEAFLIFMTETRGTALGLIGALAIAAFLTALTAGKRVRQRALVALVALVIMVGGIYLARNSAFVQNNHVLQRVTSISLADGETRFTIWHMAFQGFEARPIVGWGQEGFNYVFNTYYDPSLYAQEPWFDRAHNAFIDWLIAGGLPGFLLYLALFGTAGTVLWKNSIFSRPERIALTGALIGYAFHNLFVFDNLYSYIYFFAILALIDSQASRSIALFERAPQAGQMQGPTVLATALAGVLIVIYVVNVPGMQVASELITAISPTSSDMAPNVAAFQDLSLHPAFAAQEIREQLVSFAGSVASAASVPDATKQQVVALAITEMGRQVQAYPQDAREVLELSVAYRAGGDLPNSLKELKAAEVLSPKKEQIYLQEGATEWEVGNVAAAKVAFDHAYALGPQFNDLAAYAAAGDIATGDIQTAHKVLQQAFGTTTVDNDTLAYAYYQAKDYQDLIALWKLRAFKPGADVHAWFGLAAAYFVAGQKAEAIATIAQAVKAHPEAATEAQAVRAQIEGTTPSK